ncbi:MAG: Sec-independent protein translocase protein TatB [Rhodoferax sp.]|uniref:Sec-independent protein translocase protein TatB n=1 Tax=Rhodoferax sp. TaxID=50421 RepID=UPI002730EC3E|nr:Sec-independent protein translocase protein TatB [Rhodoferax sp.]MDP1528431.1 Sec-independent protein translocase protein TatB [Rhodoferax sp.]
MGGLGPGIGGLEILVIGLLALIVVGPKDLPLLLRKVGKAVGKAKAMAGEFRSSFDEMARQSELDELRKEVEALRTGQTMVPLGAEADAAFREIRDDLNKPLDAGPAMLPAPDEWPDNPPAAQAIESQAKTAPRAGKAQKPKAAPKAKAKAAPASKAAAKPRKAAAKPAKAPIASVKLASGKSRPIRAKKIDL